MSFKLLQCSTTILNLVAHSAEIETCDLDKKTVACTWDVSVLSVILVFCVGKMPLVTPYQQRASLEVSRNLSNISSIWSNFIQPMQ